MTRLIDKDALVVELEKRIKEEMLSSCVDYFGYSEGKVEAFRNILSFIETLEIKEMNLENEYKDFVEEDPVYNKLMNGIVGKAIAKHFFELGLKTQKGE